MRTLIRSLTLVGLLCAGLAVSAAAAAKMLLSEDIFEFGNVPQGASVSHVFWLKSVGDEPLKILQVVPGCGCTKAPLEKSEIAVGDSTRLEIVFNTGHYRNHVVKKPRIVTNEAAPERNLTFTADVVAPEDSSFPLKIIPQALDMSASDIKRSDTTYFVIRNVSGEDLGLTLIDRPQGLLDIGLPGTIEAGQAVKVALTLRPAGTTASFNSSFTIAVDGENPVRFTIPVVHSISNLGPN